MNEWTGHRASVWFPAFSLRWTEFIVVGLKFGIQLCFWRFKGKTNALNRDPQQH